jgi:hypothetical protein
MDKIDLIEHFQLGDMSSFSELYKLYSKPALGTAYLIAGQKSLAEDIVQESFIQCFHSIKTLKNIETFDVWFYKIVTRTGWRMVARIINDVINNEKGSFTMFKNRILNIGSKRLVTAILCTLIILTTISFSTSNNLKAFATETINHIKTIFVLDETNTVVEKAADTIFAESSTSKVTILSDNELSKKVGFQVFFPKVLCNDMKLTDKSEVISINKITYEASQNLQPNMLKAIDDETVFNSLSTYSPTRGVVAQYVNDKTQLFISIAPISVEIKNLLSSYTSTKVDLNGTLGYWFEVPLPSYPFIKQNDITQQDMTKRPTDIKTAHTFFWSSNEVYYSMGFLTDNEPSMDETVAIAKSFIVQSTK